MKKLRAALVAPALLLAACTTPGGAPFGSDFDAVRVHSLVIETAYAPRELAAAGAPFPIEVRGAPPDGARPARIARDLALPGFHGGAPLAAAQPEQISGSGPRLVLAFGGAPLSAFCQPGAGGRALAPEAPMEAALGLCRGERLMTRGIVFARNLRGPSDPDFAPALNQALITILPRRNPALDPGRRRPRLPQG